MKWTYSYPPINNFQWSYTDDCGPYFGHPEFSVRAISCIIDSSFPSDFLAFGGSFNILDCFLDDDTHNWNAELVPSSSYNGGLGFANPYISLMDTVFAIATVQGEHCVQAMPRLRIYMAAKCTFCIYDSSNYDTSRYIGCYTPSNNCNYINSYTYMQGGSNGPVYAITAIDTSEVYAGGTFDSAGLIKANNIARWNGTNWDSLGGGVNGTVKAILRFNNQIYAGGSFTTAGGSPANNIARWDGAQWLPLGTGTNGAVYALTSHNGELYAGGAYTQAGGNTANHVARWDGTNWTDVGGGRNDDVYALASYFGELYAGGKFSGGAGDTIKWIARYGDIATGISASNNTTQNGIQVYPNPATDYFNIEASQKGEIEILNIEGQIIKSIAAGGNKTIIDISALAKGIYFVRFTDVKSGISTTKKLSVQ